jgi:uncharacterized protein (TIGR02996 family)
MTSTREGLIQAVGQNLHDFWTRLVLADWLEENGEPEWAEIMKLQLLLQSGGAIPTVLRPVDRGSPDMNYAAICKLLRKIFNWPPGVFPSCDCAVVLPDYKDDREQEWLKEREEFLKARKGKR